MRTYKIVSIILVIALVSVTSLLIYIWLEYSDLTLTWGMDPLWVSVLVTIVLVGINAYYAFQARQTTSEMEKARKAEFMPYIKPTLIFLGPMYLVLRLTNNGKGPALNIRTEITFLPSKEIRPWKQRIMPPNERIHILLPEGNIKRVCEKSAEIRLEGTYTDIFDQLFEMNEIIDTKEFIEKSTQLKPILERDVPRLIDNIKEELSRIKEAIERIEGALRR